MLIKLMLGLVFVLTGFFVLRLVISYLYRNELPLNLNKRILSVDEHNFLNCLERALGDKYFIMPKMRFVDFSHLDPSANLFVQGMINKKIDHLCADFVLCRKKDLSVLGVVELEKFDQLVTKKQKESREKLINSMCKNMDIKLYYFDSRLDYSGMDIRRLITGKTKRTVDQKIPSSDNALDQPSFASVAANSVIEDLSKMEKKHTCPKCYADVITKMSVKGDSIGQKFLMCRKYPYCDYQVPLGDASVQQSERKEVASRKRAGYNNW